MVVDEIRKLGGKALANYDSVENGHNIIDATLRAFDRVDVLINNAGIVRVQSLESTTQADWEAVMNVNLNGSFKVLFAPYECVSTSTNLYSSVLERSGPI